jgi:hypothetical protein
MSDLTRGLLCAKSSRPFVIIFSQQFVISIDVIRERLCRVVSSESSYEFLHTSMISYKYKTQVRLRQS